MTAVELGQVKFGATVIEFKVIRSRRRRKTVEIILDPVEGILVASPAETSSEELSAIVRKRAPWIVRKVQKGLLNEQRKEFVSGESLPYLGRQARLFVELSDVRSVLVNFEHWSFRVVVPLRLEAEKRRSAIQEAVIRWYRDRAEKLLLSRVARWANLVSVSPKAVVTRNQRQRWASCSADGTLRFNWRAVMLEPTLLDYVVVHELAHVKTMNHSAEFWQTVGTVMPDFKLRRARLKEAGRQVIL